MENWLAWVTVIPFLLFLLNRQESVLNYWPKPNGVNDLLNTYNESIVWLCVLIPILVILIGSNNTSKSVFKNEDASFQKKLVIITAILWFFVPIFFWVLSQLTSLNLFVSRYFIPKEIAIIVLVASLINFLNRKITIKDTASVFLTTSLFCLICIGLNIKRYAHNLNPEHNYHHKLIINGNFSSKNSETIVFEDDPSYFANAYMDKYDFSLFKKSEELRNLYEKFSKKNTISR